MRIETGNASQIVSALTLATVAGIAIYALFFSPTSQMVVSYLHSELAERNSRISALEKREQELLASIGNREKELRSIEATAGTLTSEMAGLGSQRDQLSAQIDALRSTLVQTEFAFARDKIGVPLAEFDIAPVMKIRSEIESDAGLRPRQQEMWTGFVASMRASAGELPPDQRAVGQEVVEAFARQCQRLESVRIDLPALKGPDSYDPDELQKSAELDAKKLEIGRQMSAAHRDLYDCFRSMVPRQ